MSTGDQCIGVPFYNQSIMNPPYSTTQKTGQVPEEFSHDTERSLFEMLFESQSVTDFDADVRTRFGED